MPNDNEYYFTSDLPLATTLFCLGNTLQFLVRKNASRVQFAFYKTADLERQVKDFWSDSLRVEPKAFFGALKTVKSRLYGEVE